MYGFCTVALILGKQFFKFGLFSIFCSFAYRESLRSRSSQYAALTTKLKLTANLKNHATEIYCALLPLFLRQILQQAFGQGSFGLAARAFYFVSGGRFGGGVRPFILFDGQYFVFHIYSIKSARPARKLTSIRQKKRRAQARRFKNQNAYLVSVFLALAGAFLAAGLAAAGFLALGAAAFLAGAFLVSALSLG